ncbi:hypothetical protein MUG10_14275 [Xanthomonas prunicola]|uniref:DUF3616 domain-containing protein n=1 Tax=Xanthomonas prunicola TaxID=2053930 RepID=A0A9Q9IVF6_9XANT|nr:hypothetical protein [Xanthomonas prunicola]USI99256.1 hypothetical protein MUG10_14275 [Xanthomonas prunicola]UXA47676.1 hypothetical protein M0D44_15125 [Xanthomonas prunicola]UXA56139.1 hypothetical protein M0D47_15065 [Xanthomonas prunicola]UXA62112.1 hypothetical protein M0D48_03565 [Xanthomonas prunicola]UXA64310.1 hypothetical protein M0D43_15235 [Xanthomonas prunicola]
MHTRLRSLALAALLPLAAYAAEPSRAVLLVQTYDKQPTDAPLEYIPVWLGKSVAKESTLPNALLSQPLQIFNAGVSAGNLRLAALTVDDNSMCGGTAKLRIKGNPTLADSPLLSTVDVNPGKRFAGRAATASEQAELFRQAGETAQLHKSVKPAALTQALAAFNADRAQDLAALQIVTDTQQPQRRVAVLTSNHPIKTGNPDNPTGVLVVLAIFEHDGSRWQFRKGHAASGCDDCEDLPLRTHLLQFGDIDGNGTLDFVLSESGYESYGFYLLLGEGPTWRSEALPGGC